MRLRTCVRSFSTLVIGVCLLSSAIAADQPAVAPPQGGQPDPVRVRTVVLFSSGVGYFEHAGTVDGAATCELRVRTNQLNDLLKSLLLEDQDGGHPGTVEYPSLDPIAKTLASFQVDIGGNPSLGSLLSQLRGAQVAIAVADQNLTGTVLGVETRTVTVGDHGDRTVDIPVLNLLTDGSVRQFRLDELRSLTFTDPKLQEELGKALAALSEARDQDKKPVLIHFDGNGQRHVRLAYVVETPVWKTSYRLVLPPELAPGANADAVAQAHVGHLQGWAIVENQTDSDWQEVKLALVSGRPISFIEDLSQPLYVQRPVVQPELYGSLTPQTYDGGMQNDRQLANGANNRFGLQMRALRVEANAPMAAGAAMLAGDQQQALAGDGSMNSTASIQEAAHADTLGQLFSYTVPSVTLARQRSAMLPIIVRQIQVDRVSVYNRNVLAAHPLNGAILTNNTGDLLLQGPMTILDGSYAGDASLDNLSQGDHRLISYAIDLPVKADSTTKEDEHRIVSASIAQGVLTVNVRLVYHLTYQFQVSDGKPRQLVLEHTFRPGWSLVDTPDPYEHTAQLDRWKIDLPGDKPASFTVTEQLVQAEGYGITTLDDHTIAIYVADGAISQGVKDALGQMAGMRREIAQVQRQIETQQADYDRISKDQIRERENLRTAQPTSELYQRLQTKLFNQENQVDALLKQLDDLRTTLDQKQKALDDYLAQLNLK